MTDDRGRRGRLAAIWAAAVLVGGIALFLWKLDPSLWCALGDRHLRAGRLVEAERSYQRALDIDVDHGPALYGLGWAYWRAGLAEPARERFQRAVEFAPGYFGGYRGLAVLDASRGEVLAAEKGLRTAYGLAPGEPGILADLAGLYADEGYPEYALELFGRAIALAPERAEYRLSKAEACVTLADAACAREAIRAAEGLEIREARFGGALAELSFRVVVLEIDRSLDAGGGDTACAELEGMISQAQGHLDDANAEGLEDRIASADRRRLEDVRGAVGDRCSGAGG